MCAVILSAYHVSTWCPWNIRCPGTRVRDGSELLCRCWESNPRPLEEQPVLLTIGHISLALYFYLLGDPSLTVLSNLALLDSSSVPASASGMPGLVSVATMSSDY